MKTDQFNQEFTVDRSARSPRATAKHVPTEMPETANGEPYDPNTNYWFWDGTEIRESRGLRMIDGKFLGSIGVKFISIDSLRNSKDSAIEDAQESLIHKIDDLRERVRSLEEEKSPDRRTLKYIFRTKG